MSYRKTLRDFLDKGYAKGLAIGRANIRDDTITFRYKDEIHTWPALYVAGKVKSNGTFFEMPLAKFREMANGLRRDKSAR